MSGNFNDSELERSLLTWDLETGGSFARIIRSYVRRAYGLDPREIETHSENSILFQYGFSNLGVSVVNLLSVNEGRGYVAIEAALGRCINTADQSRLAVFALETNRQLLLPFRYCLDSKGTLYLQGRFSADELTEDYFRTLLESFCDVLPAIMKELQDELPFQPFLGSPVIDGDAA